MKKYKAILCISDLHFPYSHKDSVRFIKAVFRKYIKPLNDYAIVVGGDEIDWHSISFHDKDPELMSPSDELESAKSKLAPLFRLFPKAFVLESNHGSLVYRKMKYHGIPRSVVKTYKSILGAPKGWSWSSDLTLGTDSGDVYFHHGKVSDVTKLSKNLSANAVQFHFHEKFKIEYWSSLNDVKWAMQCGCLVDNSSLAFAYNKNNMGSPIIGLGVILNGVPMLIRMKTDKHGRWVGKL